MTTNIILDEEWLFEKQRFFAEAVGQVPRLRSLDELRRMSLADLRDYAWQVRREATDLRLATAVVVVVRGAHPSLSDKDNLPPVEIPLPGGEVMRLACEVDPFNGNRVRITVKIVGPGGGFRFRGVGALGFVPDVFRVWCRGVDEPLWGPGVIPELARPGRWVETLLEEAERVCQRLLEWHGRKRESTRAARAQAQVERGLEFERLSLVRDLAPVEVAASEAKGV